MTADARRNHAFYVGTLGLRLVKKTVNQDDVTAYHLFYADGAATPGTDITFFDWPVPRERRGTRSISRTGLRVDSEASLEWWAGRFTQSGVKHAAPVRRDGRVVLDFEDPEGQRLSLVAEVPKGAVHPWERSTVPPEHQIRGLGPITLSVPNLASTEVVLTQVLGMRHARDYPTDVDGNRSPGRVYEMAGSAGPEDAGPMTHAPAATEVHVLEESSLPPARNGAGGVHHVAFRTPTRGDHDLWIERLHTLEIPSSGPVDRFYFRSLYFREPNGILFEIATDGPGFATDEPIESLGERLALPPFLEPRRKEIEAGLKPL